ncbi:MAG: hypothetical protein IK035_04435 [Firmicutes bacterium]|nr:hypothetical protein [Bacillota bacterium]
MTSGTNFWDASVWSFVGTLAILFVTMLFAGILRNQLPFIRKLMIPSSVLGGFLILLIAFLYKEFSGNAMFKSSVLEMLTYHGLGLGFAAMSLRELDREQKEGGGKMKGSAFDASLNVVGSYLIQGIFGLTVTMLLAKALGSFFASGLILPMGYGQGPGQAYNWGHTYELTYGFTDGTSFGLTVAAMGFIASSVGGIIYLNSLRKKGVIQGEAAELEDEDLTAQTITGKGEIGLSESMDKFTVQLALVFGTYGLAYLFMRGVDAIIETGVLGGLGYNTLRPLVWGFNFLFSTVFGIIVKNVFRGLQKKGVIKKKYTNTFMQNRIAGFMFDIMVVASIAAINLKAFTRAEFIVPLLIICVIGAGLTYVYCNFYCKKVFPDYRHEAFLSLYGMLTGTASTGVILLREIDPQFKTPAANNMVYQQTWAILFGAPMLLMMGFAPQSTTNALITMGVMVVMFFLLNGIALLRTGQRAGKK